MSSSGIPIYTDMIFRSDSALSEMVRFQTEVNSICQQIAQTTIQIPLIVNPDQAVIDACIRDMQSGITAQLAADPIPLAVTIDAAAWQMQIAQIRETTQAMEAIKIPVEYVVTGGVPQIGGAGGGMAGMLPAVGPSAGGGGMDAGEAQPGFMDGMMSRGGAMSGMFAYHSLSRLATEIDKGLVDYDSISDPEKQLEKRRQMIESEHSGLRGLPNWLYGDNPLWETATHGHFHGFQPSYTQEMKTLNDAEQKLKTTEKNESVVKRKMSTFDRLRDDIETTANAESEFGGGSMDKQRALIDKALTKALESADKLLEKFPGGGPDYIKAEDMVKQVKAHAQSLHDKAVKEIEDQELQVVGNYSDRATASGMRVNGNYSGAMHAELEAKIARESKAAHKQSDAAGGEYDRITAPAMRKELEDKLSLRTANIRSHEADAVYGAHEREGAARLKGAGDNEMATAARANAAIDHRVSNLAEQAKRETDGEKKKSLENQLAAEQQAAEVEKKANIDDAQRRKEKREQTERDRETRQATQASNATMRARVRDEHNAEVRGERLARTKLDAMVMGYRAQGKDVEARAAEITGMGEIEKGKFVGDPEMLGAISADVTAKLAENRHFGMMQMESMSHGSTRHGFGDYLGHLQTDVMERSGGADLKKTWQSIAADIKASADASKQAAETVQRAMRGFVASRP